MHPRAADLIETLGLAPHPEGGWYREIYRSADRVQRDGAGRDALTTIYYLLAAGQLSRWHVVALDEVWHFHEGDGLELLTWLPGAAAVETATLGAVAEDGARPLLVVSRGAWQAARPLGAYSLVGCTVAPGFDFSDFAFCDELAEADEVFAGPLAPYQALR